MKVAIMQPYLFPYIGYFQLINSVDKFFVFDDVNYINKGWVNRNRILINGKDNLFTIPLQDASQNRIIKDIEVSPDEKWRKKFLKSIEMAYSKAPYYEFTYSLIKKVMLTEEKLITAIILNSLKEILQHLEIKTEIVVASEVYSYGAIKGVDRILKICESEKADHYINPIGGTELYQKDIFEKNNIQLSFIKSRPVVYPQFKNEFIPWLSIIDVMMFNSKEQIQEYLNAYDLI
ncbi:MAG: hypothetical protein JWO06_1400 [Bacteroidota bacterium]|nr:hypothetical protein [Bacteroidota bacterium]